MERDTASQLLHGLLVYLKKAFALVIVQQLQCLTFSSNIADVRHCLA